MDLAGWAEVVERRLPQLLPPADQRPERVHAAMRYALLAPGKRLRPILTLVVADLFGRRDQAVADVACAVEMVHACSLVLDDLPSMDDARLRRGRPTTHLEFDEATAILAAFALFNRAYALVAEAGEALRPRRYSTADMAHHLAQAIGSEGLVGGQALDLEVPVGDVTLERLEFVHSHKTGALFLAAAELGAMAADARRADLERVSRYAKNLGLAFQITDDLLDVEGEAATVGKDVGQDRTKVTFVTLLGVEGARRLAAELLTFAEQAVEPLGRRAAPLHEIARVVLCRRK
jgi:geranylgeranyl pyrophosphate synthase